MPRFFSLTPPERSQWPRNGLLKQPDMKPRVYKMPINYALWRSRHPTPNPCAPGLIPLICLASLSTRLGTTAISESLWRVFQGGHGLAPINACTRSAVCPGSQDVVLAVSPSPPGAGETIRGFAVSGHGNILRKMALQAPFWNDVALGIATQAGGKILFSGFQKLVRAARSAKASFQPGHWSCAGLP